MNSYIFIILSFLCGMPLFAELNSWPQWRGPARDGQGIPTIDLIQDFEANQPKKLWESIEIPSQDDGGFGSVISDGKRAYLSVVWHRNEPTLERIVDSIVLRKLGLNVNLPKELKQKVERDRESLSPRRGSKLDQWIENLIDDNLIKSKR